MQLGSPQNKFSTQKDEEKNPEYSGFFGFLAYTET